jgi:RNA polymerase sigma factor (sigma-70 family)
MWALGTLWAGWASRASFGLDLGHDAARLPPQNDSIGTLSVAGQLTTGTPEDWDNWHPRLHSSKMSPMLATIPVRFWRHPRRRRRSSGSDVALLGLLLPAWAGDAASLAPSAPVAGIATDQSIEDLVVSLFRTEGSALVRLARLFVDDRNAAEDLVQEAFIRLARSAHRINDLDKAPAYLRSIVCNLARDHNRRGLVSLRHHLPLDEARAATEDVIDLREDQQEVIDALRGLPHRQRECLVLRYYEELDIDGIAAVVGISRNSVKTHLTRGMRELKRRLGAPQPYDPDVEVDA